jgi:hypothetical protein
MMPLHQIMLLRFLAILCLVLFCSTTYAAEIIEIRIKGHLFYPTEVIIPANTKVKLLIINQDSTAEEFESYELNREKVILGNSKAIIFVGPLDPGEYPFFGEFNMSTALGKIIAE